MAYPRVWDVVIVGAGPAGATAAIMLAERGLAVALIDRHAFPRDKTCGDALIPDTLNCLRRLGLFDRVRALARVADLTAAYSPARVRVDLAGEFLVLPRRIFDALLVDEASARGAVLLRGRATGVRSYGDGTSGVQLASRADRPQPSGGVELRGRVVLLATGADVSVLSSCGMVERAEPSAFALRCYVRSSVKLEHLVVAFDRLVLPGYAWIFPMPDGTFNVGCGVFGDGARARRVNLKATLERFMRDFPPAANVLTKGEPISAPTGARLRCGLTGARPFRAPNILAIGEAIGATFPFTGEGIGKAMETAEIAATLVADSIQSAEPGRLASYPERLDALRPRYAGYRIAERWIRSALLSDILAYQARRSPRLRATAAGVLNGLVDPRHVFSARALLRSMWR